MKKDSGLTVTDQFCGAGGSSSGVKNYAEKNNVKGVKIVLAMNHWKLAIETHNTNFPDTLHDCTDISACDPRRYPSTNALITSPECTNQGNGNGKEKPKAQIDMFEPPVIDEAADRSRATMWDVPRFAEYHRYEFIIVENVVEAKKWIMFDAWLMAMHALGYVHKCVYLNSQHAHPTPQSRDRMYVVFWKKGNKAPNLNITPRAFCPKCANDVDSVQVFKPGQKSFKFKTGYNYHCPKDGTLVWPYYYAAINCINWNHKAVRIGDRKKPLSDKTMERIKWGRDNYWNQPLIVNDQHTIGVTSRVRPASGVIPTVLTDPKLKVYIPIMTDSDHTSGAPANKVRLASDTLTTQMTTQTKGVLLPPFIVEMYRTGKGREITDPLSTILAQGNHHGLFMPLIANLKGKSKSQPADESLYSQTTVTHQSIITTEAFNSFVQYYNGSGKQVSGLLDTSGTQLTNDRLYLINNAKAPEIEDCYFRMIKSDEVGSAMAFNNDYKVLGNEREKVWQYGNAVTPPAMELLFGRCAETLM